MAASDNPACLAAEFHALSGSQRREILAALTSFERVQFSALLESTSSRHAESEQPAGLDHFSPWLRDQVQLAQQEGGDEDRSVITAKTRAALIDFANVPWDNKNRADADSQGYGSRSLVGTVAALFSRSSRS